MHIFNLQFLGNFWELLDKTDIYIFVPYKIVFPMVYELTLSVEFEKKMYILF